MQQLKLRDQLQSKELGREREHTDYCLSSQVMQMNYYTQELMMGGDGGYGLSVKKIRCMNVSIVADIQGALDSPLRYGEVNNPVGKLAHANLNVSEYHTSDRVKRAIWTGCKEDGGIVIDGKTGQYLCFNFIVSNLAYADGNYVGARSRAASSIAMQAGKNVVIKVSEDSCGSPHSPPPENSKFDLFLCTNVAEKRPLYRVAMT